MGARHDRNQRRWLAELAARWMSEHALDDPLLALRRVLARQPHPPDRRQWPKADEILNALRDHQRLFRAAPQARQLHQRRLAASQAMDFFSRWQPRLIGPVLDGTADAHSPVQLHLHTDQVEALLGQMVEQGIEYRIGERRLLLGSDSPVAVPHARFEADGIEFELWLLPRQAERQPPRTADGHPIPRASLSQLRALLELHSGNTDQPSLSTGS